MAEGFAKHYGRDVFKVYSGGTKPADTINPNAVAVMKEVGIRMRWQYPKSVEFLPNEVDILIHMGCGIVCPFLVHKYEEDWGFDDPDGRSLEEFRKVRDQIKEKVEQLIAKVREDRL